ncbi:hypothetical protein P3T76_004482 [Phytophthora citrophthora]|uniref:Uncharacterized protein n=1 Tax=Phytophthora citrophthora TaxID=4793 RepID=A0AAD9LPD1_9STRA|nr:hypothetical protein P3T76_004482 [Phytophthora citrophthora]
MHHDSEIQSTAQSRFDDPVPVDCLQSRRVADQALGSNGAMQQHFKVRAFILNLFLRQLASTQKIFNTEATSSATPPRTPDKRVGASHVAGQVRTFDGAV